MTQGPFQRSAAWRVGILLIILGSLGATAVSSELLPRGLYLPVIAMQVVGTGLLIYELYRQRKAFGGRRLLVAMAISAVITAFVAGIYFALVG